MKGKAELIMKTEIKFDSRGLIPAVVQDADNGDVLMVGYMNEEALKRTLTSGDVWFYSRSRQELWHKGETSGNFIRTVEVWKDCDNDTILVKARPVGPVCHTGNKTCFFQKLTKENL
jgi:phosphoribosyl-AMP cyclohydrolase